MLAASCFLFGTENCDGQLKTKCLLEMFIKWKMCEGWGLQVEVGLPPRRSDYHANFFHHHQAWSSLVNCPSRWSLYLSLALCVGHLSLSIIPTERQVQQCIRSSSSLQFSSSLSWRIICHVIYMIGTRLFQSSIPSFRLKKAISIPQIQKDNFRVANLGSAQNALSIQTVLGQG